MPSKHVAILGSAFDPPHYAHVAMACLALEHGGVDEVWLCPSPDRWDKTPNAPGSLRLLWIQNVAEEMQNQGIPVISCSDELDFPAYRGSFFFLNWLSRHYEHHHFSLLVGADAWLSIPSWRDPVANEMNGLNLLRNFNLLVVPRPGSSVAESSSTTSTTSTISTIATIATISTSQREHPFKLTRLCHPALPLKEQAQHQLLPDLTGYELSFARRFGVTVNLSDLSSSLLRKKIIEGEPLPPFCFPRVVQLVMRSNIYFSR